MDKQEQLEGYWQSLVTDVDAEQEVTHVYPEMVFFNMVKDNLIEANVFPDMQEYRTRKDDGNKKFKSMKVDAGYVDPSDNSIHLMIVDYDRIEMGAFGKEKAKNNFTLMLNFIENCDKNYFTEYHQQSASVFELVKEIKRYLPICDNIFLYCLTNNKRTDRLMPHDETSIKLGEKTINVNTMVIDITYLYNYELSTKNQEPIVLDVKSELPGGIPCLKTDLGKSKYDAYLAVVPGAYLSNIYKQHGSRLLELNVRSFLSARGGVNKGIKVTLRDEPDLFFTYNNGIACVADEVKLEKIEGQLTIVGLKNLQIINGGQTTASLRNSQLVDKTTLDQVFVPMKLTILHDDIQDEERMDMVRNISKYSNTQNKVNASDLSSGSKVYIVLEKLSRSILTPVCATSPIQTYWFFERSRGQYERDQMEFTKKKKESFKITNPVKQRIKIVDIAKFWNAVELYPYDVSWGGQVNSSKFQVRIEELFEKNPNSFNELFYKKLISKAILFLSARLTIEKTTWYKEHQGILALITPYTVSKLVYECSKNEKSIDWMQFWKTQTIGDAFDKEIVKLSEWVYKTLNDNKKKDNFGEWCKLKEAWEIVKNAKYTISDEVKATLISSQEVKAEEVSAKKERAAEANVEYAMVVFNQGSDFWIKVNEIALREHLYESLNETKCVQAAIKCCKQMELVADDKAATVMKVQKRLESNGYDVKLRTQA